MNTIVSLVLGFVVGAFAVFVPLRRTQKRIRQVEDRFRPVLDLDTERARLSMQLDTDRRAAETGMRQAEEQRRASLNEMIQLQARLAELRSQIVYAEETATLESFGVYRRHYDFPTSSAFDAEIARIEQKQKEMIKLGRAATCTTKWVVEGSEKKGAQWTKRLLALLLRAFNGECDAAIAAVKFNNVQRMEERIQKSAAALNRLTESNYCLLSPEYVELRLAELRAVHEQREKLQAEKDEQRALREQMRDEEIALREMERAKQEAEREEVRYSAALAKARAEVEAATGAKQDKLVSQISELERLLSEARANKERAIARAQMTRSGHVYVISNIGSFGEHVYKIGMTRRLDPMERIRELSDASVPFSFDVHAVVFAEDAPGLENALHQVFEARRVNIVNPRKEFFCVDLEEIAKEVRTRHGDILFTRVAHAEEYRKTAAILAERGEGPRGWGTYDRRSSVGQDRSGVVA